MADIRLVVETPMNGGRDLVLRASPGDTVGALKHAIWTNSGIPPYHQALVFKGRELSSHSDGLSLSAVGLRSESRLKLQLLTRSGPLFFRKATPPAAAPEEAPSTSSTRLWSSVDTDTGGEEEAARRPKGDDFERRWEDERRTRARMRKIQDHLDRLRVERAKTRIKDAGPLEPSSAAAGPSEPPPPRKLNFGRSSLPHCFLSAPEDTSAKESSAGETEYEEWAPSARRLPVSAGGPSLLPPPPEALRAKAGSASAAPRHRGRVVSSSSEPESSGALWSELEDEFGALWTEEGPLEEESTGTPPLLAAHVPSPPAEETPSPSELSSGMIMCEWANDNRRVKVTRRKANQPKTTASRRAATAEAPPTVKGPPSASQRPRSKGRVCPVAACPLPTAATSSKDEAPSSSEETSSCDGAKAKKPSAAKSKRFLGEGSYRNHRAPHSAQSQLRCHACAARLSLPHTFQCRCGKAFCARHRHPDMHTCSAEPATKPVRPPVPKYQPVSD